MLIAKIGEFFRRVFKICIACLVVLNTVLLLVFLFTPSESSGSSFGASFVMSLGGVAGAATGTMVTCYVVDAAIAPIAPPAALALAGMCPAIGSSVGGIAGFGLTGAAMARAS
jgi:hypothetical protein